MCPVYALGICVCVRLCVFGSLCASVLHLCVSASVFEHVCILCLCSSCECTCFCVIARVRLCVPGGCAMPMCFVAGCLCVGGLTCVSVGEFACVFVRVCACAWQSVCTCPCARPSWRGCTALSCVSLRLCEHVRSAWLHASVCFCLTLSVCSCRFVSVCIFAFCPHVFGCVRSVCFCVCLCLWL